MLSGRRTGCQFAKQSKQSSCGSLVAEAFESHDCRKVRRSAVKADAHKILVSPRCQRIHHGSQLGWPIVSGGQNHWSGAGDGPCSMLRATTGPSRPAMADYVQMKAGRKAQIGFEGESFLLAAPTADKPSHRLRTRPQTNRQSRIFEPARRQVQGCVQQGAATVPARILDSAFAQAG